ncbi:PIN domain-containing protein [Flavobacterium sp. UBA6031]|uniref:PIN domain-containing protein n=1 Tax=Flavobacterium sp. UBA6031 TaxID=1946551 RepID=UPI0025C29ADE|nr:PIN domain-containing protein [Flavobacterium sp. UBA6031]
MNVFLDSNILFKDYFFEKKSPKNLLDYAKRGLINLYMSEIVRLELRRQFIKEIESKKSELEKILEDITRLKIDTVVEVFDLDLQLEKFDKFYTQLISDGCFEIVHYKNDYLPDIVDKAIYRKKPFTEEKTELKDAIIWKSYADFAETNDLEDCILLTNNTTDFCNKGDKSKIHNDLLVDSERFFVFNSAFDFLKEKSTLLESPEHKFQIYISKLDINNELVHDLILENFNKQIEKAVNEKIEKLNPNDILKDGYWYDGYVEPSEIEIFECSEVEYDILTDSALVSGIVYISVETECFHYNASRDTGEDQYSYIGGQTLIYEICFNFDLRENEDCSDFEITNISLDSVN